VCVEFSNTYPDSMDAHARSDGIPSNFGSCGSPGTPPAREGCPPLSIVPAQVEHLGLEPLVRQPGGNDQVGRVVPGLKIGEQHSPVAVLDFDNG
jgi:hypothetical protein